MDINIFLYMKIVMQIRIRLEVLLSLMRNWIEWIKSLLEQYLKSRP